jgi:biotin-(acetyl-CoA carboxylase) ligase
LNVDNEKPTTCLNAALQEANHTSPILKREDILAYFFNKFENLFEVFLNHGTSDFISPIFAVHNHMLIRIRTVDVDVYAELVPLLTMH